MTIQEAIKAAAKTTHHITRPVDDWWFLTLKVSRYKNEPLTVMFKGKSRGYWDPSPEDLFADDWFACNEKHFGDGGFMGREFDEEY